MLNIKKLLLFGFLIWLIPFIVSFAIFPLRESNRALFESIMPIIVVLATIFFTALAFKSVDTKFVKDGAIFGFAWLIISISLDLVIFLRQPMNMTFYSYFIDIGLTYLIIPVITMGVGFAFQRKIGWLNK